MINSRSHTFLDSAKNWLVPNWCLVWDERSGSEPEWPNQP